MITKKTANISQLHRDVNICLMMKKMDEENGDKGDRMHGRLRTRETETPFFLSYH